MNKLAKILVVGALVITTLVVSGCDFNPLARKLGGDITVKLPANTKLINASWKENSIWYLTRPMRPDESPETYQYKEDATYGVLEGTVTIIESKE